MSIINKTVFHKKHKDGKIIEFGHNAITVAFANYTARFVFPDAFEKGFLTTDDSELKNHIKESISEQLNAKMKKRQQKNPEAVLFCNISWMENYMGKTDDDIPVNGGDYVKKHKDGNEKFNFYPIQCVTEDCQEGKLKLLGSFETKSTNGMTVNQTHIEKIRGCKSLVYNEQASGVTVVWCAAAPEGGSCVVGWYKDATVFRHYQQMDLIDDDGYEWERWYNVSCVFENATLLPSDERLDDKWMIPRSNLDGFGFGQANIWYAEGDAGNEFADNMINNINSYTGYNVLSEIN